MYQQSNIDSIRNKLAGFMGNIPKTCDIIQSLKDDLRFDLDIRFNASNRLERFTNIVRNLVRLGVIDRPLKSGRSSILNEKILLQILVSRRYLSESVGLTSLSGYLTKLSTEELYDRLFAKQLSDIDKVVGRNTKSVDRQKVKTALEKEGKDLQAIYPIYHYIKVKPDLFIHVKADRYRTDELKAMVTLLAEYIEGRTKSES